MGSGSVQFVASLNELLVRSVLQRTLHLLSELLLIEFSSFSLAPSTSDVTTAFGRAQSGDRNCGWWTMTDVMWCEFCTFPDLETSVLINDVSSCRASVRVLLLRSNCWNRLESFTVDMNHRGTLEGVLTIFSSFKVFSEAFHLRVNNVFTSFNGLTYSDVKKIKSVGVYKNNVFKQNTARLFSINTCQVGLKPFVWAGQACIL